ncbi:MAG: DUF456 domain-containing protein [Candidatus Rifleibacteriota bacterium]
MPGKALPETLNTKAIPKKEEISMTVNYWLMFAAITGVILNLAGIIGCFVPVLPGPTLNLLSLIILHFVPGPEVVSLQIIILMCFLVLFALLMDNLFPILTAKAGGSSREGMIGATTGLVLGIFLFPPFGMFIGALGGALLGEYYSKQSKKAALKAGLATMLGFGLSLALKLAVSGVITWYFIVALWSGYLN